MRTNRLKTLILVCIVCLMTIIFHYLGWLKPIEVFLRSLVYPASESVYNLSISNNEGIEEFSSVEDLKIKYRQLKESYLSLKKDVTDLELLREENKELREMSNFFMENKYKYISADVIGKNLDHIGSSLIIDIGEKSGLEIDNPVVTGNGILVGRIWQVGPDFSVVRLLDDNQSRFAATLLNTERSLGVVEGGFGLSIRMNLIPQNEKVEVGDEIVTSGLEKGVPKGLLIGSVEAVEKEPHQPFQSAVISPVRPLDTISLVSVITSSR